MSVFITNIFIFSALFSIYLCNEDLQFLQDVQKKLNVVIFFTHVDTSSIALQKNTLGFLNLREETRVKHSSDEQIDQDLQDHKKGSAYCKDLLKNSLMTLTHFCHTVMKMKTAVASVSSKEMINDIQEPEGPFHSPQVHIDRIDEPNRIKRLDSRGGNSRDAEPTEAEHLDNLLINTDSKSRADKIITGAKHTEVFEIRTKRKTHENGEEIPKKKDINVKIVNDVPSKKTYNNKHPWDVLDVMKHVRYSFFGKLFENTVENQVKADQEEDLIDLSKIGQEKQDSGLFSMVKSTLDTLLEPPESNFLMVIFGGHLHAVTDKHSTMVQSIKHVIENTDSENTLIIVTGSCEEEPSDTNNNYDVKMCTMPVYAKGPNSDILKECSILYDIPLTIRKILEVHSGTGLYFPESKSI